MSAGNQRLLGRATWTPLVGDRADGSMQHQEQQQRLALATSTSVLADINVLCVASELHESTRALASASPSHAAPRQRSCGIDGRTCIQYHATRLDSSDQAAVLVSGTVGWRPETSWCVLILAAQQFVPWPTPRERKPSQVGPHARVRLMRRTRVSQQAQLLRGWS